MKRKYHFLYILGLLSFVLLSGGPSCDCDTLDPEPEVESDPADRIYFEPDEIDFGPVSVGLSDTALAWPRRETYDLPDPRLMYELVVVRGHPDVYLGIGLEAESLLVDTLTTADDDPEPVPVTFAPRTPGLYSSKIRSNKPGSIYGDSLIVSGIGVEGCVFSRNDLDFGDVDQGTSRQDTLVVRNITGPPGGQNRTVTLENTLCPPWSFVRNGTPGQSSISWSLSPGEAAVCTLQFTPPGIGDYDCDLKTNSDSYCGPIHVSGSSIDSSVDEWITCHENIGPDLHSVYGKMGATLHVTAVGDSGAVIMLGSVDRCSWGISDIGALDSLSLRGHWKPDDGPGFTAAGMLGDSRGNGFVLDNRFDVADQSVLIDYHNCVWGTSPDNVYAAGLGISSMANGRHWNGTDWTDLMIDFGWSEVTGIYGSGPDDIWAVLKQETYNLYHYNGTAWSDHTEGWMDEELHDVWVHSSGIAYAVGANRAVYYYDGSTWHDQSFGVAATLYGVFGSSPSDVYAVGQHALIYHWDGFSWRWQHAPAGITVDLYDVWVNDDGDAYAVGQNGTIIRNPVP
jgi:hypothetical protein